MSGSTEGSRAEGAEPSSTAGGAPRAARSAREGEPPPAPDPLPAPALDSHCHLDLMDTPVAQALAEARAVGIATVVQIGIDVPTSHWSARVAAEHDDVLATVALHPNEAPRLAAKGQLEGALEEIDRLAALPR